MLYKCIMANTSAIWQQAAHTTYQLSSPSCSTRAIQKSPTLIEKYLRVFWREKSHEIEPLAEKWQDRKSKRTRQKKTREDTKGKSNDSPEIPDKRGTSDIPGLPSGSYTSHIYPEQSLHTHVVQALWTSQRSWTDFAFHCFKHGILLGQSLHTHVGQALWTSQRRWMDVAVHCFKHGIISGQSLHTHVMQTLWISEGANLAPRSSASGCVTLVIIVPAFPLGPKQPLPWKSHTTPIGLEPTTLPRPTFRSVNH